MKKKKKKKSNRASQFWGGFCCFVKAVSDAVRKTSPVLPDANSHTTDLVFLPSFYHYYVSFSSVIFFTASVCCASKPASASKIPSWEMDFDKTEFYYSVNIQRLWSKPSPVKAKNENLNGLKGGIKVSVAPELTRPDGAARLAQSACSGLNCVSLTWAGY